MSSRQNLTLVFVSVHMIEAPQNGCHQQLYSQDDTQLLPAFLGDSPGSVGRSDPGSYQITASAWVPEHVRFYVHPLTVKSFFPSSFALLKVSPTGLQSQVFWKLIFLVQDPWAGEPDVELRSLTLWGVPLQGNYLPVCGSRTSE